MKKSINAWAADSAVGFEELFRQVRNAGFDGIELNVDAVGHSAHSLTLETTEKELGEIRALSERYELPVVSVSTSMLSYFMGSPDSAERGKAKEIILCQLKSAKALGAGGILVVPGGVVQQGGYEKAYRASAETLAGLKDYIVEMGVNVGVENVWNGFFLSPFDMARFIDGLDCPRIGAYYDVGNVIAFSWSEYWIDLLGSRIKNIHVKDFKRNDSGFGLNGGGDFVDLLKGDVNWMAVVPALQKAGFDGYLTAEVFKGDSDNPDMSDEAFYSEVIAALDKIIAT